MFRALSTANTTANTPHRTVKVHMYINAYVVVAESRETVLNRSVKTA